LNIIVTGNNSTTAISTGIASLQVRAFNDPASQAAARLFVHPNTVRHRLRRISAATGRSLSAPRDVAELCLALEAARQNPATP